MSIVTNLSEPVKHGVDLLSLGALVGALMSLLPAATIALSFFWVCLRCFETWQNVKLNSRKLRRDDPNKSDALNTAEAAAAYASITDREAQATVVEVKKAEGK